MGNKTLILSTTKAFGKGDRFNRSSDEIKQIGNLEIYQYRDELIFVRDLIIKHGDSKEYKEVNQEIYNFTRGVINHSEIQNIDKIIYFIHAEELDTESSYEVLSTRKRRVLDLKQKISKGFKEQLGFSEIIVVAYRHGRSHFWAKFLSEKKDRRKPELSWVENLELSFKERQVLDNKNKRVDKLSSEVRSFIKSTSCKTNGTSEYNYHLKIFAEGEIDKERSIIHNKPDFQIINTSKMTFSNRNSMNVLGREIVLSAFDSKSLPTIVISEDDIMYDSKNKLKGFDLDKRYRFFDSNIWVRYVSKAKNQLGESLVQQLERVIGEIKRNIENKIYETNVAKEYIEYQYRLFENSYLSDKIGGGHARDVTPFIFHSETYMQSRADKLQERFCLNKISWRLLLVDDFADKKLNIGEPRHDDYSFSIQSKKEIIEVLFNENTKNKHKIFELSTAVTVDAAIEKLKNGESEFHYDVILLDYLFSNDQKNEKTKYGTELLVEITKNRNLKKAKAFNYKFWIYPVSVFSDALHSSLREQGVQYLEEDWVLGRGADPINTPQLFRYDFLDFIKVQYDGVLYKIQDIIDLLLSDEIVEPDEKIPIDVRAWARRFYHSLWTKFGKAQSLIYKSRFTESVKKHKKRHGERKAFVIFENLETVLHNLAFASIFDFEGTEMTYLKLYEDLMEACDSKKKEDLRKQLKKLGEGIYGIHQ